MANVAQRKHAPVHRKLEPKEKTAIYNSIKDSFGSTLLSALSVIQGAALAALGAIVVFDLKNITLVRALQVIATFLILIGVWDTITRDALIWKWIPGFQESLIPFVLGAAELYLSYAVILSASWWFGGVAIVAFFRGVGFWHVTRRGKEEMETAELLNQVRSQFIFAMIYSGIGTLLFAIFVIPNLVETYVVALIGSVLVLIWIIGTFISTNRYWRMLIVYIRPVTSASKLPK